MPIFMDRHDISGVTAKDVAEAHQADLRIQSKHACNCFTYWFDEGRGTVFCLIEAPTASAVRDLHLESHGLNPSQIIEVDPSTVANFLGRVTDPDNVDAEPVQESGFRSIMFTDMANSTDITNSLGDNAAFAVLKKHRAVIRQALLDHHGREVDRTGDGFLTCFTSVSQAVSCSMAIQQEFDNYNHTDTERVPIQVRIGLGAGEPVTEKDELFGSIVNLTARICAQAKPNQILASHVIRELCIGKNFAFQPYGAVNLKGFPDPIELDAVEWKA
ncbi:DUF4242 domain-containing protein [Candidatus Marinimicrobia bacterium MT.SAG.3]|nr:DUF4242 domain-containing protein [Candidatus Marinimicrobia bacterium MT.SAG.3]